MNTFAKSFSEWTQADADAHNAKMSKAVLKGGALKTWNEDSEQADDEGDLHDEIIADLRALGWPYAHNRMDKKSTAGNGVTDFIIAGSRGRTFWIECKARGKKRSPAQQAFAAQLERFGHVPHLCKSIEEFREIVKP